MSAAIYDAAPDSRVISLMHDAPAMRSGPRRLPVARLCQFLPVGSVIVAVVDPGVGGDRAALVVEAGGKTFVGRTMALSRLPAIERVARIDWQPAYLSASFHGRDLFAPVAAPPGGRSCRGGFGDAGG